MLPAQVVFLAASQAVLSMASDSGLWAAATRQPGTAILAGVQARSGPLGAPDIMLFALSHAVPTCIEVHVTIGISILYDNKLPDVV